MEFHNELARVLGTHQCAISKANTRIIFTKSIEVKSGEEEEAPPQPNKSQIKKDRKISAQSFQIKDLWSKLDQAVAGEFPNLGTSFSGYINNGIY